MVWSCGWASEAVASRASPSPTTHAGMHRGVCTAAQPLYLTTNLVCSRFEGRLSCIAAPTKRRRGDESTRSRAAFAPHFCSQQAPPRRINHPASMGRYSSRCWEPHAAGYASQGCSRGLERLMEAFGSVCQATPHVVTTPQQRCSAEWPEEHLGNTQGHERGHGVQRLLRGVLKTSDSVASSRVWGRFV